MNQNTIRGWILYNAEVGESHEIKRLREEAPQVGIDLEILDPKDFEIIVTSSKRSRLTVLVKGEERELPDFFWARLGAATSYFALSILREMERHGVQLINKPDAIEKVKDKFWCHQILAKAKLPIPKSILGKIPVDIDLIDREIGFPAVIKMLSGSQGKEVFLAQDRAGLQAMVDILEVTKSKANIIIQKLVTDSYGKDIRVFIAGGRILACMQRNAPEGDFRANISNGGVGELIPVNDKMAWIALEAAKVLGLDIAGVDLLFQGDGYLICEVNSSPGFRGLEKATNSNVARMILEYIKLKIDA